jgi:hypothetical protein
VTTKLKAHPYADLLPMMSPVELETLTEDVRAHGLVHDIVLYQGKVLDGRNRLVACDRAGVEPRFKDFEGDDDAAMNMVLSLNVARRNLTTGQRAIFGARCMNGTPLSRADRKALAAQVMVGEVAIQQARALLEHATDLADQVATNALSLAAAYEQLQDRQKLAAHQAKAAGKVARYSEAISNDEMTIKEALEHLLEEEREEKEKAAADGDERRDWLAALRDVVRWGEEVEGRDDDKLAWYTQPGSPGLFDHGVTAERVGKAIDQLRRVQAISLSQAAEATPKKAQQKARMARGRRK